MINMCRLLTPSLAVAGLVAAVCLSISEARAQAWGTFSPPGGDFSVQLPTQPKSSLMQSTSFIGDITDHVFTAPSGTDLFTVTYSKLPRFALDFAGADTVYEHAKGALLRQTLSKPISFTNVSASGRSGKKLLYQLPPVPGKPPSVGEAHFFLVDDRVIVVDAIVPSGGGEPRAQRFLDSIQFE
jgi:hypothetical protein